MKLVAIGDIHAHNFKDYSKTLSVKWCNGCNRFVKSDPDEDIDSTDVLSMNSRLFYIISGLSDVLDYCIHNNIKYCLVAGDIFHSRGSVDTVVFNSVYRVFESFCAEGIKVIMIAGNHDQFDSSTIPENSLYSFRQICHVVSSPESIKLVEENSEEVVNLCALPYSKDKIMLKTYMDKFIELNKSKGTDLLLMAHLGLSGSMIGSANYVISDEWNISDLCEKYFKYSILGHYHKPQFITEGCFYTGSLLQNTFNDEGDGHGFMVLDTSRRWDVVLHPLEYPQFITINKSNIRDIYPDIIQNNYIRVQSTASDSEELLSNLDKFNLETNENDSDIRFEIEKEYGNNNRSDVSISMNTNQILEAYVEGCITNLDRQSLVDRGLSIINKIQNNE